MMRKSEPAVRWGLEDGSASYHCDRQYGQSRARSDGRVWFTSLPAVTQFERCAFVAVGARREHEVDEWRGVTT